MKIIGEKVEKIKVKSGRYAFTVEGEEYPYIRNIKSRAEQMVYEHAALFKRNNFIHFLPFTIVNYKDVLDSFLIANKDKQIIFIDDNNGVLFPLHKTVKIVFLEEFETEVPVEKKYISRYWYSTYIFPEENG